MLSTHDLDPDEWYEPHISSPALVVIDRTRDPRGDLARTLSKAIRGGEGAPGGPVRLPARRPVDQPWLLADAGAHLFSPEARKVIDVHALPGDVRWVNMIFDTPEGPVDTHSVIAPSLSATGVFLPAPVREDGRGPFSAPLDRRALTPRAVLGVPRRLGDVLILRGWLFAELLDLGVEGVIADRPYMR